MVPEWVLDADIGDCALRLYAVLLRYGNSTGTRMPSRATPRHPVAKKSVDTVDRALGELVGIGAVQVEHRWTGHQRLTNRDRVRTSRPDHYRPPRRPLLPTRRVSARTRLARTRVRVAATVGAGWPHESGMTENLLPRHHHPLRPRRPGWRDPRLRPARDGDPHIGLATNLAAQAVALARPSTGGVPPRLARRLWRHQFRCVGRRRRPGACCAASGRPAPHPLVRSTSPGRCRPRHPRPWLAGRPRHQCPAAGGGRPVHPQPGPPRRSRTLVGRPPIAGPNESVDVSALEAELDAVGGLRVELQRTAREQLAAEGRPVVRATVISRAVELLHEQRDDRPGADDREVRVGVLTDGPDVVTRRFVRSPRATGAVRTR